MGMSNFFGGVKGLMRLGAQLAVPRQTMQETRQRPRSLEAPGIQTVPQSGYRFAAQGACVLLGLLYQHGIG
ncbi:hypothetical protein B9Z41_12480 [Limnohabitans sp. JirII-31]|nr:hypothetical protein B9Z41_12480 [Limnohabitans sp. JirII-31]